MPRELGGFTMPKPGRGTTILLGTLAGAELLQGLMDAVAQSLSIRRWLMFTTEGLGHGQVWRLLTSALVVGHWVALLFDLLAVYFLGTALERLWGAGRLVRFFAFSVVIGNLVVALMNVVMPAWAPAIFRPSVDFGPYSALAALTVAWGIQYPDRQILLFFVIPVRGAWMVWLTLAFCVLGVVYDGRWAPFGGLLIGVAFGGTPSWVRTTYLRFKLARLKRDQKALTVEDVLKKPSKSPRQGGPSLKVLKGGLDKPSKDKRWLN